MPQNDFARIRDELFRQLENSAENIERAFADGFRRDGGHLRIVPGSIHFEMSRN